MKDTQIKYILETILQEPASATVDKEYVPLLNNFMMVLNKEENLYSDINRWRYKFDFDTKLIERILVRPYSHDILKYPAHGNYDTVSNSDTGEVTVYEYITDKYGHILKDVYSMGSVIMFIPQPEVRLW